MHSTICCFPGSHVLQYHFALLEVWVAFDTQKVKMVLEVIRYDKKGSRYHVLRKKTTFFHWILCPDQENMPIPSVVIEPASSNEGDDDRDADIISPTVAVDNDVAAGSSSVKHMSACGGSSALPDDFLYKVGIPPHWESGSLI